MKKRKIGTIIEVNDLGKFKIVKESPLRFVIAPNTDMQEFIHVEPIPSSKLK